MRFCDTTPTAKIGASLLQTDYSRVVVIDIAQVQLDESKRLFKELEQVLTYLAPLKRVTNESNVVTHNPIRPGTFSCGIKTDAADP